MPTYNEPKNDYTREDQVTPNIFNELAENERYLYDKRCEVVRKTNSTETQVNELVFQKNGDYYEPKTRKNGTISALPLKVDVASEGTKLVDGWTEFTKDTLLPYGTYLIQSWISDNSTGVGQTGTMVTDVISFYSGNNSELTYRNFEYPMGPNHYYVANDREAAWYRAIRIKITLANANGFKLNLFVTQSGGYISTSFTGKQVIPDQAANTLSEIQYKMKYKRIM